MKKKHLLRSILAIALCILMIGTAIAVGYTIYENVQGKKVVIDKDNNLPVVKPSNGSVSAPVTTENGLTVSDVTLKTNNDGVLAVIPQGTKLNDGVKEVTLTVKEIKDSQANIELEANEEKVSYDIHIEGVANDNTAPIRVYVKEMLPSGLNMGNYSLYHVENGTPTAMTAVNGEATHNSFEYDAATGDVTLYLASFSEVALVADTVNAWEGNYDYTWYNAEAKELVIANADQLAAFGAIVGGTQVVYKNGEIEFNAITRDSFKDKTVKLITDINLGDDEKNNVENKIFHPIGYYYQNGDSTVQSFEGTFDGNGHKVANFYHNTWEIKGDYNDGYPANSNHYKDAMGLFGYVNGGTIKNLTVDNFSSDGEFTPTGVIAAYVDGKSLFENIAITNCNPRVYNTGNGGIIGIAGDTRAANDDHITLKNITVDNSNKISALWGSWDVACGGLVGMYRGNVDGSGSATGDTISFQNCHVSAQIDVYNDVCANYQYYAYRYSGMIIGSVRHNTKNAEGKTIPNMTGISANDCTVNYGTWNDYYYCEFVKNSMASYSEDYQFSRVDKSEIIFDAKGNITGCAHEHTDEEDKTAVYLPFHQLFTGYSWGVNSIGLKEYSGIVTNLDIIEGDQNESVVKFQGTTKETLENQILIKIGDLFKAIENAGVDIKGNNVQVTVSPADSTSTVVGTYVANTTDWTQGTLTFSGVGAATITITDYYFCTPTTINVTVANRQPVEKFDIVMNNGDFLHRVGNIGTVALDKLFKAKTGVTVGTISVTVDAVNGTSASGTYSNNAIQFNGTGVVKVTITDNDYCTPTVLYLEVVEATNATSATDATKNNVVLLNDIGSGFTVSGNYTVFGNGFTLNYTGDGRYLNNGLKQGIVTVSENGTLDNLKIKASIYPTAFMYYGYTPYGDYVQHESNPREVEGEKTRYYYQLSGVVAKGNATISNCYIYGARTNIFVDTGDVTIKDTILECGTVANVQIQSTNEYTVTFENVTTIQYQVNATIGDTSKVMLGAGVLVGPDTTSNPAIVLNGDFKQYNWVNADDQNAVSGTMAQMIIQGALNATAYNHTINEKTSSNLGIIYMNEADIAITNNTGLPYEKGTVTMTFNGTDINGQVYSLQNATAEQVYIDYTNADRSTENGDYIPRFDFDLGDQELSYDGSEDTRYLYGDKNGVTALYQDGDDALKLDLTKLATIYKYDGLNYTVTAVCKDSNGNTLMATNGVITLDAQGSYTLEFTVTDNIFYDEHGEKINKEVTRTYNVPLTLTVKEASIKSAVVNITKTALDGVYNTVNLTDYELRIKFLDAISVTDYDNKGNETTVNLSSNISSATLTPASVNVFTTASTITITYTDGRVLTVNLSKISGSSPGTKTAKVNTSGSVYFTTDGALNNKPTEATSQNKCTITSVSFKGNNGATVTNDNDVTVTWALGSSSGSGPCVTPDTLITLADGTQVRVDSLTGSENLVVWNHETGKLESASVAYIVNHDKIATEKEIIHLYFSNGSEIKIIGEHVFYDATLNKYIAIDTNNAESYIGHKFLGLGDNAINEVELVSVSRTVEITETYEIVSYKHLTCFTNGILSTSAYLDKLLNIFDIDTETYAYDTEAVQKDIETYGLYTYADFEGLISEEAFELYNAKYLKIAVEKGYITWDDILDLIDIYFNVDVQPIQ